MEGDDRARLEEAAAERERERKREWYRENAALVSERHRARYATDPEFRAKRKAVADRYRAAHREEIRVHRRHQGGVRRALRGLPAGQRDEVPLALPPEGQALRGPAEGGVVRRQAGRGGEGRVTRPRGEGGAKFVVREQRKRDRLREETQGLADCGRASNGRYVAGCRCDACKAARSAYERGRARTRGYGRPTGFVDAEPVRAKVRQLQAQGYTYAEMERLAGVPHSTLHGLMCRHWRTGRPVKRCRRELKDRLCSIKGQRRLSQAQRVDASWMAEQLRSYRSHGVSAAEMARRIGCDRQVVDALLHGKRGRVRAETLYKFMLAKPGLDEMRKSG